MLVIATFTIKITNSLSATSYLDTYRHPAASDTPTTPPHCPDYRYPLHLPLTSNNASFTQLEGDGTPHPDQSNANLPKTPVLSPQQLSSPAQSIVLQHNLQHTDKKPQKNHECRRRLQPPKSPSPRPWPSKDQQRRIFPSLVQRWLQPVVGEHITCGCRAQGPILHPISANVGTITESYGEDWDAEERDGRSARECESDG